MIEARGLTKRYGPAVAVDALGVDVRPGAFTGFLGPNGSGKSTTMRMIMGLDRPDRGSATMTSTPSVAPSSTTEVPSEETMMRRRSQPGGFVAQLPSGAARMTTLLLRAPDRGDRAHPPPRY